MQARSLPWRAIRSAPGRQLLHAPLRRTTRYYHNPFREGDRILLQQAGNKHPPILTKPLHPYRELVMKVGSLPHSALIGQGPATRITTSQNVIFTAHYPSLAEYCRLTERLVTPIYGAEASAIVTHLDLHVDPADAPPQGAAVEILEAGTGHGALTLHLARAVHAAGQAVVHTVDISEEHSRRAQKTVRGFRRGLYADAVRFHVGTVGDFVAQQRAARASPEPYLSHVVLDMPSCHDEFAAVVPAMRPDAKLAIFCPSVTQIVDAVREIHLRRLPLKTEQVVELGASLAAGRPWDVHFAQRRIVSSDAPPAPSVWSRLRAMLGQPTPPVPAPVQEVVICKPTIGNRTLAGGFLAVWSRTRR